MYDTLCNVTYVLSISTNVADVNKFMKNVIAIENGRKAAEMCVPRKMNEVMAEAEGEWPSLQPLFDEFWREGELAVLFGAAGSGKSILAMQLAEALARGSGIDGFRMASGGRRVLYVDLQHADFQHRARYRDAGGKRYSFSERLERIRPPADVEDIAAWLRTTLSARRFDVVVIDDLSSLRNTVDGTREVLKIMRDLKRLRDEMMVSILVISDAADPRGKWVSEADLGRSRVLSTAADSVFALGSCNDGDRRIVQTRSRNAPIVWNTLNAPGAGIRRLRSGLLAFEFDGRFVPDLSPEQLELIRQVKRLYDGGMSYRAVGEALSISKSRAERLYRKWTPAIGGLETEQFDAEDEDDGLDDIHSKDDGIDAVDEARARGEFDESEGVSEETNDGEPPKPKTIYDLPFAIDRTGRHWYIEREEHHTKRPMIWYMVNEKTGKVCRCVRRGYGVFLTAMPNANLPEGNEAEIHKTE